MLQRFFFLCISVLVVVVSAAQRDTISINDEWQFTTDRLQSGVRDQWFNQPLPGSRLVRLPHTWNIDEADQNHYGWGWYQKKLHVPAHWKNKKVVIRFGAINHSAYIYLNGEKIAENTGDGFNSFSVSLTDKLQYGKTNNITILVNNDFGRNKIPFGSSFDWPNDGGLIRKVSLIVSDKPSVNYIAASPRLMVGGNEGKLQLRLGFDEKINLDRIRLAVTITEENQPTRETIYKDTIQPAWDNNAAMVDLVLSNVNPWHFDFPRLYRVDVKVLDGKKTSDHISTSIGFRDIKFENGKTYLNGERIKLMGVEWTAGSNPDYGFAESDSVIISQCKLMKEVNAIFTRQHFQQDELFYDFCDRNGILVQQELPLWGPETPANDTMYALATKQLERMVRNNFNHTSVFSWGVGNELRGRDPAMKQFIGDLIRQARQLDPTRMTAYVSNTLTWGFSNQASFVPDAAAGGDYLMMNEYGGSWWDLPTGKIGYYLDSVHMSYPSMPFFISEFGLCEPNFKGGDERRIEDMIYHMGIYESKSYVEGAIYFDLTDYRTHYPGTKDNNKFRRRIHGVYDMYGRPKPSMRVLRELSSPVEVQQVRQWKKGKLHLLIFGSIGLPEHSVKGYTVYVSEKAEDFTAGKSYRLPDIKPGQRIELEVDEINNGHVCITILRPTGFVVSQK
ncbi:MAG TPA: glycoside hydrolase family 2 TIM barrel-domain containing protein, partial [Chitinophagaceae bacterium]|nr:glycoside hydrolase family 2 TIM barrel-domain containing protein [Chitinophagaceae bacterium]